MIRAEPASPRRSNINPLRGEFAVPVDGALRRFDTRLATVAALEAACGDRAIADVLNAIIVGRRARDVIALLSAALATADPPHPEPDAGAARATLEEAEAFVLALVFALGFKVGAADGAGEGRAAPLAGPTSGAAGGNGPSAG